MTAPRLSSTKPPSIRLACTAVLLRDGVSQLEVLVLGGRRRRRPLVADEDVPVEPASVGDSCTRRVMVPRRAWLLAHLLKLVKDGAVEETKGGYALAPSTRC